MLNRRDFIVQSAATGGILAVDSVRGAQAAQQASRPLRMLILGATGFIGPHFVPAAVERGHKVSVFLWNRDTTRPDLPAGVELLTGDRAGDLESIKNRDWDAVLDLAVYVPSWVRSLGEALQGRVKHYTFISTESAYDIPEGHTGIVTEDSPVRIYKGVDPFTLVSPGGQYGAVKVLCEREAEKQFPGKVLILRPDYIVGPGDPQAHLTYWPVRMQKGGEMMVAGSPATPVQFVDIRDLAAWAIRAIEKGATGVHNVVGPAEEPLTLGQMLSTVSTVMRASPKLTWVPTQFLADRNDDKIWSRVTFWTPEHYGSRCRLSNARARASGFTTRPLAATLTDTLSWYQKEPAEKQAKLLYMVRKKADGSGPELATVPWPAYLEREKTVLAAWHAQKQT